jgi:hypothetical protein
MTPTKVQLPFATVIDAQNEARPVLKDEPRFIDWRTSGQLCLGLPLFA